MLAVLFLDWLRPADQRTHFGRFFDSIISGQALGVLARKIGMNIDILTQSWMTLVLPLIIIGVFWLALDPQRFGLRGLHDTYRRVPLLRAAVISLAILLGVGTLINDSGIVVPAVGILFLVPVLAHLETFRASLPPMLDRAGEAPSSTPWSRVPQSSMPTLTLRTPAPQLTPAQTPWPAPWPSPTRPSPSRVLAAEAGRISHRQRQLLQLAAIRRRSDKTSRSNGAPCRHQAVLKLAGRGARSAFAVNAATTVLDRRATRSSPHRSQHLSPSAATPPTRRNTTKATKHPEATVHHAATRQY
jgi:hypothetical protein